VTTTITAIPSDLCDWHSHPLESDQLAIWWLGQSGFLVRSNDRCFVIDPYLSDSLAEKYRDKKLKHQRMMPIPIKPSELRGLDAVFATHRHTDHLDVGTLPDILGANPGCRLIAPRSAQSRVAEICGDQIITTLVDAGEHVEIMPGLEIDVVAAAHEELQYDADGHAVFLGYVFTLNGTTIYHSGDCVPYDGLVERLRRFDINVALLPVNGRDEFRQKNGVPGNFHFEEAVDLCQQVGIKNLVPHHYGMFDFNTVDLKDLEKKIEAMGNDLNVILPQIDRVLVLERKPS
jgi:L-ascorbate metabolism protein UlaG (beta-lactamase superfamily)